MKIYLDYTQSYETIEDTYGDDGPYTGFKEESITTEFLGLYKTQPKEKFFYESLEIYDEELLNCEKLFAAIVIYSDGGTFGKTNGYWKILGLERTEEKAQSLLDLTLQNKSERYPWNNYFASLQDSYVKEITLHD